MLVRFNSSETGEIMMFADIARQLLQAVGKECSARGVFTRDEMLPAALILHRLGEAKEPAVEVENEAERQVSIGRRAWPLIDMLERTARSDDARANIVWQASADF